MAKITLFGLAGTGTSTVGRLLAEKIGYEFKNSGQIFRDLAVQKGMDLYEFEAYANEHPEVDTELDQRIADFGRSNDRFIFDSRLAWYFIPDSIKIKLGCDFDERTRRVAERDQISHEEAKQKTVFRENSGRQRYINTYGIADYSDDSHFDLIVDATDISPEDIVRSIELYLEGVV